MSGLPCGEGLKIHSAAFKHVSSFSAAQSNMSFDNRYFFTGLFSTVSRFLSTQASEMPRDRLPPNCLPQANLDPGRDVNNFPSLYFPPPFKVVLVLSCCLLFCCSGALRGDLICASLLNPRSQNNNVFI